MKPPSHEFHVVANEIHITFDVPLPREGADEVLRDLLFHHAMEIIRDRKRRSHPLGGIPVARIFAKQANDDVEVGSIDLDQPDEFLEIEMPMLLPLGASPDSDPFRKLGEPDMKKVMALAEASGSDELAPVGKFIRLTAGLAASLRSHGVDPDEMTVTQLGLGLLDLTSYSVTARPDGTYVAAGGGTSTFVSFVDHEPGDYPELSLKTITQFLVAFADARTERGLLVTDKFGPYAIYEKERANPRCHFITRERLQALVDSIAVS